MPSAIDGRDGVAKDLLDELLALAWQRREDFVFRPEPLAASIAQAKALEGGPIVIADHGDNSGAGGPSGESQVISLISSWRSRKDG